MQFFFILVHTKNSTNIDYINLQNNNQKYMLIVFKNKSMYVFNYAYMPIFKFKRA